MHEFMNWFLDFLKQAVLLIFSFVSADSFSFGYMMLGIAVLGAVVSATVGAVAIVSNALSRGGRD